MEKLKHLPTAARVGEMNTTDLKSIFGNTPQSWPLSPQLPNGCTQELSGVFINVICGSTSSQSDLIDETWALGALDAPRWF